jgi:Castor and Pollux, part of voltage-gated ion channel/Calcium-activated potassium channel slowpoke-like RCK domain
MTQAQPRRIGVVARLRYRFDTAMSRGTGIVILWLAAITFGLVFVAALVLTVFGIGINEDKTPSLLERFWQSLLRILDPGTFSGDAGWPLRITMLLVTLLGVLIGGSLIGLIVAAVDSKVERLRRGRSVVVERGHTLILGWSPRVFTLISEIVEANANQRRRRIVVLAPEEKPEMEAAIRERVGYTKTTRIVCRTGDPSSPHDLRIVNADEARSIVVLAGGKDGAGDAEAVKAALAVTTTGSHPSHAAVVAELNAIETAHALYEATGGRVTTVRAVDVVARITAQACRQPGLSFVWQDLLDFTGDEIYLKPAPELEGHTYGEALLAYEASSVIGRRSTDGTVSVNPPTSSVFGAGDSVIAISADDDTIVFSGFADESADVLASPPPPERLERLLVVGWSHIGPFVLRELDPFAPPGSEVDVLVNRELVDPGELVDVELDRLQPKFHDTGGNLDVLSESVRSRAYDKVIILGYREGISPAEADARALLTLLILQRALGSDSSGQRPRIVTELLDARDVDLARGTGADDFVVSDELSSLMLAQLAERSELEPVFADLFDVAGSAIVLHPVTRYVATGPVRWRRVVAAARERGQTAIGYRVARGANGRSAVELNPPKTAEVTLGTDDQVVVIAPV